MKRLFGSIDLLLIVIVAPSLLTCQSDPVKPRPPTFEEQIAGSSAYANFRARGIAVDLAALKVHDLSALGLGSVGMVATTQDSTYGIVGFAFDGDRTTVGQIEGYGVQTERDGLIVRVRIESSDGTSQLRLGFNEANGLVFSQRQLAWARSPNGFDWPRFFDCIEARAHDLPAWVDVTCGASLFFCIVGSATGCFASAVCAAVYAGPCLIEQFQNPSDLRLFALASTDRIWRTIITAYR